MAEEVTGALKVQSVLFAAKDWRPADARAWLRRNRLPTARLTRSPQGRSYRARLMQPTYCKPGTFKTLSRRLPHGVRLVTCRVARRRRNQGGGDIASVFWDPVERKARESLEKMRTGSSARRELAERSESGAAGSTARVIHSADEWDAHKKGRDLTRRLYYPNREDDYDLVVSHLSPTEADPHSPFTAKERWDVFKLADGLGKNLDAETLRKMGYDFAHVQDSSDKALKAMARAVRAILRKKGPPHTVRTNAPAVRIYPRVAALEGYKGDGKLYRHEFTSRTPILGLPDGSILIPARDGLPLWGSF